MTARTEALRAFRAYPLHKHVGEVAAVAAVFLLPFVMAVVLP